MGSRPAAIVAGALFDGERFREGPVCVDVSGGRIAAVRPLAPDGPLPFGALDAREHALLPGLIDAHCHAARVGLFEPNEPPDPGAVVHNLVGALARGVTTLGDMGCTAPLARALRALGESTPHAPAVRSSGPLLADPLGYPLDWMPALHKRLGAVLPCGDERAARDAVARVARAGMDHVKMCIMHKSYAYEPLSAFSASVARAIVDEAHRLGLRAVAHAHWDADYRLALDAGVDALMHSSFDPLDEDTVRRVRDAGVPVCATLWVFHSVCLGADARWDRDAARTRRLTRPVRRSWRRFAEAWAASGDVVPEGIAGGLPKALAAEGVKNAKANLMLLHDAGVPIVHGSDGPYGFSEIGSPREELGVLFEAGLDVEACLRAATSAAAALLGAADRGSIAPGQRADFVLLPRTIERDLGALDRIHAVYRGGVRVELGLGPKARLFASIARGYASTFAEAARSLV